MHNIQAMSKYARHNLRYRMHKVAAVMAKNEGLPLVGDEITIKEAAHIVGFRFWKNYLEKRAMLNGIAHIMRLR